MDYQRVLETFIIGTLSGSSLTEEAGPALGRTVHSSAHGPLAIDMSDDIGQLDYRKLTSAVGRSIPASLQWTEGSSNCSITNACSGASCPVWSSAFSASISAMSSSSSLRWAARSSAPMASTPAVSSSRALL